MVADIFGVSKNVASLWKKNGKLDTFKDKTGKEFVSLDDLKKFKEAAFLFNSMWFQEEIVEPKKRYTSVELFAGAGGLALGLENAGIDHILLNEIDKDACATLKSNRSSWNIINDDVRNIDFSNYKGVDLVSGGFPCQAFSYAGHKLGFKDTRGTLFYEFARAVKEIKPKVILAENVRGLINHEQGRTLEIIKNTVDEIGYKLVEPKILKALFYKVPQKRERLFLIALRKDLAGGVNFKYPEKYPGVFTLKDALKAGQLYNDDVPVSPGQIYPKRKKEILSKVPPGGYWRDLPENLQKEFMLKSYYLGGGKTGVARKLSWDEPSLTLTCAPAQKQTERCHPDEVRPLTIREYARIQTFPDTWEFIGSTSSIYKQIGNAVPVNLAFAVARSIVRVLNKLHDTVN